MRARLITAEEKMLYTARHCKGDASETGLVQFAQAIMDLDQTRGKFPVHKCKNSAGKETECLIPFSSDIKFNAFIRDMNPAVEKPTKIEDNLCIYLKGAPDRVLKRCNKILINGEEVEMTDQHRKDIEGANAAFANLGERVLGFAQCRLDPAKYPKDSYQFEMKTWSSWGKALTNANGEARRASEYENIEGSFPMHDLVLVGLVSLNDPPRFKVDLSVNKCRSAGIKVIMVTGDQPPTAAAIANKVNIIKHPKQEFNYLCKSMDKTEAWEKCTGVVVHGDLLAEKHLAEEELDDMDPIKGQFL